MIKIKMIQKWKRSKYSKNSTAIINVGTLRCIDISWSENVPSWVSKVTIGGFIRCGSIRRSETKARQDAEKLAVDLLRDIRDIRDGTKELMDKSGMGEDD